MIGLLIQGNIFEQDIRELLMSFYPGEIYAHEVKEGVDFYVESRLGEGQVRLLVWDQKDMKPDREMRGRRKTETGKRTGSRQRRTRKHRLPALPCPWTAAIRLI